MRKRLSASLAVLILLPGLALAHGSSSHGHFRHQQTRSSVHFGLSVGNGFYHPGYYSGYYSGFYPGYYSGFYPRYWVGPSVTYSTPIYTSPPVVIQSQPPVYIERPASTAEAAATATAAAPAPASAFWYYCAPTQSYYPYVSECAEAWQRVSPVPPAAPASRP